jgi:hypothetical protein
VAELTERLRRAPRPSDIAAELDFPIEDVLEALRAYQADSLDETPPRPMVAPRRWENGSASLMLGSNGSPTHIPWRRTWPRYPSGNATF